MRELVATTCPETARTLLDGMCELGIPFAILHDQQALLDGVLASDVDVAVSEPVEMALAALAPWGCARGLYLVCVWPYDVAGLSTFWMTEDGAAGAQLDLLYDPAGRGKYGLRTDLAVRRS